MPDGGAALRAGDEQSTTVSAGSPLVHAAERLVTRITALVDEMTALREENAALRREVKDAVALLDHAGRAAAQPLHGDRRAKLATTRRRRRGKATKGRATPDSVTAEVVRAVLAKLGTATAAEIAQEITKAGAPVSGRAVRFLAERAGAQTFKGEDGQRRYRM